MKLNFQKLSLFTFSIAFLILVPKFLLPKSFDYILRYCEYYNPHKYSHCAKKFFRIKNALNKSRIDNVSFNFSEERIETSLHNIDKKTIQAKKFLSQYFYNNIEANLQPVKGLPGGYLEVLDQDKILISNSIGNLSVFSIKDDSFREINSNLNDIYNDQKFFKYLKERSAIKFGVKDIFIDKDKNILYVSITKDITGDGCYGMGIYKTQLDKNFLDKKIQKELIFQEFYQTNQCNKGFNGHETGGRISKLNDRIIYTIGDLGIHGNPRLAIVPENEKDIFGQILSLSEDGKYELLSRGHRNPQGLVIVDDNIYITEHGPKGGDEINLIQKDNNYGWPIYSYGLTYKGEFKYKFTHEEGAISPIYYFRPSIGISQILFYERDEFPLWKNKFLIASLRYSSIYLIDFDFENQKVKSIERIFIGHRVRDFDTLPDGKIIITTDDKKIIKLSRSNKDVRDGLTGIERKYRIVK